MAKSSPRRPWQRLSAILVGLAVSAGFSHLLISRVDVARVGAEIGNVDVAALSLCLVTTLAGLVAMTARSAVLLRPVHRYRPFRLFKSVLFGFTGNNVLPLRAGELLRIDYLARHGGCPHSSCLAVLAVERLFDLFCLVLLFFSLLPLAGIEMPSAAAPAVTGAVVVALLCGLGWIGRDHRRFAAVCRRATRWTGGRISRWMTAKARRFASGLASLQASSSVAAGGGLSAAYWLATVLGVRLALGAFDFALPWYAPAVVVVFIAFGVALPSAPAFIGTYHYFAMLALTLMGIEPEPAVSFAVVLHAVSIVPFTALGILLLLSEILRGDLPLGRPADA